MRNVGNIIRILKRLSGSTDRRAALGARREQVSQLSQQNSCRLAQSISYMISLLYADLSASFGILATV